MTTEPRLLAAERMRTLDEPASVLVDPAAACTGNGGETSHD